jgi:hypothetical protein
MSSDSSDRDTSAELANIIEAMRPFDACFARLRQFRTMLLAMGIPDAEIARLGRFAMDYIEAGLEPPSSEALLIAVLEPGRSRDHECSELREALVVADKGAEDRRVKLGKARKRINRAKDETDNWTEDVRRSAAEASGDIVPIVRCRTH